MKRSIHVSQCRPRLMAGFMLLEALVGILIFSIGVLGLVALQASMTRAQTSSKMRADAAYLANEAMGTLRADIPNMANYVGTNCANFANCASLQAKVAAALPGGALNVQVTTATGDVTVTISWTLPNDNAAHQYQTNSVLRASGAVPT